MKEFLISAIFLWRAIYPVVQCPQCTDGSVTPVITLVQIYNPQICISGYGCKESLKLPIPPELRGA